MKKNSTKAPLLNEAIKIKITKIPFFLMSSPENLQVLKEA